LGGPFSNLILGVYERYVGQADKAENVAQIGFLKVEFRCGTVLPVAASARSDDDDLLVFKETLGTMWPIGDCLSKSHDLIDPRFK
jgi:hypothetical protein